MQTLCHEGRRHSPNGVATSGWFAEGPPPVLFLRRMPPFQDFLVCGLSTQLQQAALELDELIGPTDADYRLSGLKAPSLIRLGFLAVLPKSQFKGRIGQVSNARVARLLTRLAEFLRSTR